MSVLQRCPSYGESNKGSKERQGPTLGVRLIEVSVKRESTVYLFYPNLFPSKIKIISPQNNRYAPLKIMRVFEVKFSKRKNINGLRC